MTVKLSEDAIIPTADFPLSQPIVEKLQNCTFRDAIVSTRSTAAPLLVTVDTILFFSSLSMTFFCLLSRLLVKYDFVFGTSYCSLSVINKVRSIYYICITTYIVMVNGKKSMNKNEGKKSKF